MYTCVYTHRVTTEPDLPGPVVSKPKLKNTQNQKTSCSFARGVPLGFCSDGMRQRSSACASVNVVTQSTKPELMHCKRSHGYVSMENNETCKVTTAYVIFLQSRAKTSSTELNGWRLCGCPWNCVDRQRFKDTSWRSHNKRTPLKNCGYLCSMYLCISNVHVQNSTPNPLKREPRCRGGGVAVWPWGPFSAKTLQSWVLCWCRVWPFMHPWSSRTPHLNCVCIS
jgi:hypothetical protein